ncbi:MAG: alkaline shock response membrane anchor protein AmaP [bacterium]|nr:alkaline shock response membrane anchor protein AmaP [bacterium]
MDIVNRIGITLVVVALVLIGGLGILFSINLIDLDMITSFVVTPNSKIYVASFSLLLVLISILVTYTDYRLKEKGQGVVLDNPLGKVDISKQALQDFIKRIGQEESNIRITNPAIVLSKKGVVIKLETLVSSNRYIPEAISNLQTHIKDRLEGVVGIPNVSSVVVKVSQIGKAKEERIRRVE